ncbi:hypothetical protein BU17DRAFT_83687 [Hysterangium stoloniferum]|nr:hypothetical protein BU17DRAFT_83687 [Hysterangium stoloniferum]
MRPPDRFIKHIIGELVAGMLLAKETPPDVNFNIGKDSQSFTSFNLPLHRRIEWPQKLMKNAKFVYTNSNGLTDELVIARASHMSQYERRDTSMAMVSRLRTMVHAASGSEDPAISTRVTTIIISAESKSG